MNFRSIEMPIQGLVTVKKLFKAKLPSHRRGDGMGWDGMGWRRVSFGIAAKKSLGSSAK